MFSHETDVIRALIIMICVYSLGGLLVMAVILAFLTGLMQALAAW